MPDKERQESLESDAQTHSHRDESPSPDLDPGPVSDEKEEKSEPPPPSADTQNEDISAVGLPVSDPFPKAVPEKSGSQQVEQDVAASEAPEKESQEQELSATEIPQDDAPAKEDPVEAPASAETPAEDVSAKEDPVEASVSAETPAEDVPKDEGDAEAIGDGGEEWSLDLQEKIKNEVLGLAQVLKDSSELKEEIQEERVEQITVDKRFQAAERIPDLVLLTKLRWTSVVFLMSVFLLSALFDFKWWQVVLGVIMTVLFLGKNVGELFLLRKKLVSVFWPYLTTTIDIFITAILIVLTYQGGDKPTIFSLLLYLIVIQAGITLSLWEGVYTLAVAVLIYLLLFAFSGLTVAKILFVVFLVVVMASFYLIRWMDRRFRFTTRTRNYLLTFLLGTETARKAVETLQGHAENDAGVLNSDLIGSLDDIKRDLEKAELVREGLLAKNKSLKKEMQSSQMLVKQLSRELKAKKLELEKISKEGMGA